MTIGTKISAIILLIMLLTGCYYPSSETQTEFNCWELNFNDRSVAPRGDCRAVGVVVNESGEKTDWVLKNQLDGSRAQILVTAYEYAYHGKLDAFEGSRVSIEGEYVYDEQFDFLLMSKIYQISELSENDD